MLENDFGTKVCYDCFHFLRFTLDTDIDLGQCTQCQRYVPMTDCCPWWTKRSEGIKAES